MFGDGTSPVLVQGDSEEAVIMGLVHTLLIFDKWMPAFVAAAVLHPHRMSEMLLVFSGKKIKGVLVRLPRENTAKTF